MQGTFVMQYMVCREGRCKASWKSEFQLPWREASPPNDHDDEMDSDQKLSLSMQGTLVMNETQVSEFAATTGHQVPKP